MISCYKEIKCDNCGDSDTYLGTKAKCEEVWERHGGLVINNKHFCNGECYKEFANCTKDDEVKG